MPAIGHSWHGSAPLIGISSVSCVYQKEQAFCVKHFKLLRMLPAALLAACNCRGLKYSKAHQFHRSEQQVVIRFAAFHVAALAAAPKAHNWPHPPQRTPRPSPQAQGDLGVPALLFFFLPPQLSLLPPPPPLPSGSLGHHLGGLTP